MEIPVLQAKVRRETGSRAVYRLRQEGRMPGILYGEGGASLAVHVDAHDLEAALRHHERVIQLDLGDQSEKVLLQDLQWDEFGYKLLHVDFLRISEHALVEVDVELEFVGHPKGMARGGEFVKHLSDLPISCPPELIPETIPVRISELDLDGEILVRDLQLPEGVRATVEPDQLVCALRPVVITEEPTAAEEGEEAEGEAEPEVIARGKAKEGEGEGGEG